MRYLLVCDSRDGMCDGEVWIRGHMEYDTNAIVLDDNDSKWELACAHIQAGDYIIKNDGVDDE